MLITNKQQQKKNSNKLEITTYVYVHKISNELRAHNYSVVKYEAVACSKPH